MRRWRLPANEHERTFQSDESVLRLDRSMEYIGALICVNSRTLVLGSLTICVLP